PTTTWTVPVDDTNTMGYGFQYHPEQGPRRSRFQYTGTRLNGRTYEERQRQPGDYEALVSQRSIAVHSLENLGWSDTGVRLVRKLVREGVHDVQRGEEPRQAIIPPSGRVTTYGHSVVLRVPHAATPEDDKAQLRA